MYVIHQFICLKVFGFNKPNKRRRVCTLRFKKKKKTVTERIKKRKKKKKEFDRFQEWRRRRSIIIKIRPKYIINP